MYQTDIWSVWYTCYHSDCIEQNEWFWILGFGKNMLLSLKRFLGKFNFNVNAPLNRDDGSLLPDAYLHLFRKKGS